MFASCAVLLLALSQHFNTDFDYNEVHPSIGVYCEQTPLDFPMSAGYFYNSEKDHTLWAAKRDYWDDSNFYYEIGVAVGYDKFPVAPFGRVGYDFGNAEVFLVPGVEKNDFGTKVIPIVGIQFKYSF